MTSDEQIGRNLTAVRGDMPQKELAEEMRKRGFKWSQATVWSVEKGERPLRLAEAKALAELLTRPLDVFVARDGEEVVHSLTRQVFDRYEAVMEALKAYDDARGDLAIALDRIPQYEKTNLLRVATDWVPQTVDVLVENYRDRERREFSATLAREDISEDRWFPAEGQGTWLDTYNEAQRSFWGTGEAADGQHQEEA